jgi:hypothetical protein
LERDKNVPAIFKILIAVLLEFYKQVRILSCDVGKIIPNIFRKLFALMTHRDILGVLNFQDWNFTEYWKQFQGFSGKRIKKNMKYLIGAIRHTEEPA